MTLLQYYLLANIYLLFFWVCFRICLKNLSYFRSLRIYLNSVVVLAVILPFVQMGITNFIASTSFVTTGEHLPFTGFIYQYQLSEKSTSLSAQSFYWPGILRMVLILGSVLTAIIHILNHFRIKTLIEKSTAYLQFENGLSAMRSDQVSVPFIYINRILIPKHISINEINQVIRHEVMHYRKAHYFDNILFSVFHTVFWINPAFFLLRRELKLNHEYQVDQQMLSTGIDPVSYKLSLVKYSVGNKLFSLANGLSSSKMKRRLLMMNRNPIKKGKWRLYFMLPAIGFFFSVICVGFIQPDPKIVPAVTRPLITQDDSLIVEIIDPYKDMDGKDVLLHKDQVILVLMNWDSDIMVAKQELSMQEVQQKIISLYNAKIEDLIKETAGSGPESPDSEIMIHVSKDIHADEAEYRKLIDNISSALLKLREWHAVQLYGSTFTALTDDEQEAIAKLIPLRIYGNIPAK